MIINLTNMKQELLGEEGNYGLLVGANFSDLTPGTPLIRLSLYRDDPVPQIVDVFVPRTTVVATLGGMSVHPSDIPVNASVQIRSGAFSLLQSFAASWGYFKQTHEF